MLSMAIDEDASVAVWLMTGRHNSDEDYERYVTSLLDLRERARVRGGGTGLFYADRDNPVPNAAWRRKMAEASKDYPPNCLYAMVSESMVVRGVVTAINWLRPPTYDFVTVATMEEALAWLRARRDARTMTAVEQCLARAREAAHGGR
jgi:hypothetical protein